MKTDPVTEPDPKVHEKYGTDPSLCPYCNPARRKPAVTDAEGYQYLLRKQMAAQEQSRYLQKGPTTPDYLWQGFIDFYNSRGGFR